MAAIAETRISVRDVGAGVIIEALVQVQVAPTEQIPHKITQADLGLTPAQVASLQAAVNAIRNRAINVTKVDFTIP